MSAIRIEADNRQGLVNTVVQPEGWAKPKGYANAVRCANGMIFTGGGPEHLTRLTGYVTSVEDYLADPKGLGAAYREAFGRCFPAMATVEVTRLVEPEALVEIEATAVVPPAG